ncbi:MAG: AAA family ATPase [Gemmatimonadetes bacterium]|nr:AAA family ATPase [Gemmatimonadota bacterium]
MPESMPEQRPRRSAPDLDLFAAGRRDQLEREQPLAERLRPAALDDFVGQDHILGPGRLLRRAIQADQLSSLIFYGPPGTGKTTLAHVIANTTRSHFITINAVLAGVADIRQAIDEARERRHLHGQRTILFIDEVHRFNKAQQDALLPWVENGTVILIGATTENPYFAVNRPLVSRSRLFQLKSLTESDLDAVARNALTDPRGYGDLESLTVDDDALAHLVDVANGDARALLNALELAVETTAPSDGRVHVDLTVAEESIQRRAVLYDKEGDYHFDSISAFIKSMRGSDPDAALYWMARMVYAGEDPRFIFRRMIIFASEDVGLADPGALPLVVAAAEAFDRVGLPEGRFALAQAALHLATAPKSNSSMAFFDALGAVEKEREDEVPNHLKDANRDSEGFGHGEGYLYPHAYRDHWVAQQYLPANLQGRVFYQPSDQGHEAGIRTEVARRRELQLVSVMEGGPDLTAPEHLSHSPDDRARDQWLERAGGETGALNGHLREAVFRSLGLERHHRVLDLAAGSGLLTWEALRRVPEGTVWSVCTDAASAAALRELAAAHLEELDRPRVLEAPVDALRPPAAAADPPMRLEAIVGRNAMGSSGEKEQIARQLRGLAAPGCRLRLWEVVQRRAQRLCRLVDLGELEGDLKDRVISAEEAIYDDPDNPRVNWEEEDLKRLLQEAGFETVEYATEERTTVRRIATRQLGHWFNPGGEKHPTFARYLHRQLDNATLRQVRGLFERQLNGSKVRWTATYSLFSAVAP